MSSTGRRWAGDARRLPRLRHRRIDGGQRQRRDLFHLRSRSRARGGGGVLYGIAYPQINTFMGVMPGLKSVHRRRSRRHQEHRGRCWAPSSPGIGDDDHGVSVLHLPGQDRLRPPHRRPPVKPTGILGKADGEGVTAGR